MAKGLEGVINNLSSSYKATSDFVKREKSYVKAAFLASSAVVVDGLTTSAALHGNLGMIIDFEINPLTKYLIHDMGVNQGLVAETALTIALALPLSYALNRLTKKPLGTYYLYLLSAVRIGFSASNLVVSYICR
jgi:hypothetical protein